MALTYPGISYLKGYDGKVSDIFDAWLQGEALGKAQRDEDQSGDLIAKLFSAQQGNAAPAPSRSPIDQLVFGSHDAATAAQDPLLTAYFANTRRAESGGNDTAANPNSSALGRYQFLEGTWNDLMGRHPELGLTADGRTDPGQQERAMKAFTMENARQLSGSGIPVTPGALYAAHFLGAGGAAKVLGADPNSPVSAYVDPDVVSANPQLAGMTVADFQQWANQKGGGANGGYTAPMVDAPAPAAAPAGGGRLNPELMGELFRNAATRPLAIELMKAVSSGQTAKPIEINNRLVDPYTGAVIADFSDTAGGGELGLNPQYGVDENGNPVLIQLGKDGRGVQTELPPGVTLSKEPIRLDAGTHFVLLDPITRQPVGQVPKENYQEGFDRAAGAAAGKYAGETPERKAKATSALQSLETKQSTVASAIDKALDNANFWTTGIVGQLASAVPGSPAYDLARTLDTIKANIGFNELQTMRDNSPTGGALGAISERELAFLQSTITSIEQPQSEAQLRSNLEALSRYLKTTGQQRRAAFEQQYGSSQSGGGQDDEVDAILKGYGL